MRAHEILNENLSELSVVIGGDLFNLIKKIESSLSITSEATRALDTFVGIPHNGIEMGMEGGIWSEHRLEDAYSKNPSERGIKIRQEIEQAFAPIRKALQAKFGNTVTLYRAQRPVASETPRNALSWTCDPYVALHFAGAPRRLPKPITDADISAAVAEYEKIGYVLFRGKEYERSEDNPKYYNIYKSGVHRDHGFETDGDNLEADLKERQAYFQEFHDLQAEARKKIVTKDVPIQDIIWITDRANQSEFIINNRGGHYIGPTGI
jgi:hypothetical protein